MSSQHFSSSDSSVSGIAKTQLKSLSIQGRWLEIDHARERLLDAWAEHESMVVRAHDWFRLSQEARAAHPENARFAEIDAELERLEVEGAALLDALPTDPATGLQTIIENLAVAERIVVEDENPVGHGLVARAIRDLELLNVAHKPA